MCSCIVCDALGKYNPPLPDTLLADPPLPDAPLPDPLLPESMGLVVPFDRLINDFEFGCNACNATMHSFAQHTS